MDALRPSRQSRPRRPTGSETTRLVALRLEGLVAYLKNLIVGVPGTQCGEKPGTNNRLATLERICREKRLLLNAGPKQVYCVPKFVAGLILFSEAAPLDFVDGPSLFARNECQTECQDRTEVPHSVYRQQRKGWAVPQF
jgi:hypothetical protein